MPMMPEQRKGVTRSDITRSAYLPTSANAISQSL
jgi:hypothetical protein